MKRAQDPDLSAAVDAAIKAGASECLQSSNLNESSIARASAMPLMFPARNATARKQKTRSASCGGG
jgi:hypothetical protein